MRIIYKFISVVLLGVLLPIVVLGYAAYFSIHSISGKATEQAIAGSVTAAEQRALEFAEVKAADIARFFQEYEADVSLFRDYFEYVSAYPDLYNRESIPDHDLYAGKKYPGLPAYGYVHPVYGAYADFDCRGKGCPWLPKRVVSRLSADEKYRAEIADLLDQTMLLTPLFAALVEQHKQTLDLAWIVTDAGVANVFPAYDYNEFIRRDASIIDLDESEKDYVRLVNPQNNPSRQTRWLDPYLDPFKNVWMTSCVAPLYRDDSFFGAVGADILLSTITDKILHLRVENYGYAFLISGTGAIVALPEEGMRDMLWDEQHKNAVREAHLPPVQQKWTQETIEAVTRWTMDQTPDTGLRKIISAMMKKESGVSRIQFASGEKLIVYAPVPHAGWSIGVVVPVAQVIAPATTMRKAIGDVTREVERTFLLLFLLMIAISALVGLQVHYRIIKPLVTLSDKISRVRWETMDFNGHGARRKDEIGRVYAKFSEMLVKLKTARDEVSEKAGLLQSTNAELQAKSAALFASNQELERARDVLKEWAEGLEHKVAERTRELEQTRDKLVRTEKLAALGKLAGSLSHELRNPLAVIANAVYYLTLPGIRADALSQRESIYIIKRQVEMASRIIENALDFANPKPLEIEKGLVNRTLDTVIADIVVPRGIKIERNYKSMREAMYDPYLIGQLFSNILRNSIQAIKVRGSITIDTSDEKDGVKIVIQDTGCGIARDDLDKVSEPLFSTKPRGIGLGLHIARGIVERHKGILRIESEEGSGTVVTVELPFGASA